MCAWILSNLLCWIIALNYFPPSEELWVAQVERSGLAPERECSASISRRTRGRTARWDSHLDSSLTQKPDEQMLQRGRTAVLWQTGEHGEIDYHKLFSQGVPTTALGLTRTAATCEVYGLWSRSKKRRKRCLVCGKESFHITVRCQFLAVKIHMTLGGFFNKHRKRGKQGKRSAFARGYGIDCWSQQGWQQKKDQSRIPVGGLRGAAAGDKHRALPSCLEQRTPHVSGVRGNTQTSGTSLWLTPEPGRRVASRMLKLVGSGLS